MSGVARIPDLAEIEATVARMESRYAAISSPEAIRLMDAYRQVRERFAADLADSRDLALARSAALMMLRELIAESPPR